MKLLILSLLVVFVIACSPQIVKERPVDTGNSTIINTPINSTNNSNSTVDNTSINNDTDNGTIIYDGGGDGRTDAPEGAFCGGIVGITCAEGLYCQLEGKYPDAGGTCIKS